MNRRDFLAFSATTAAIAIYPSPGRAETKNEMEPVTTSIQYDIGKYGWSSFKLIVGDRSVDVGAFSYTTDALDDLIRTGLQAALRSTRFEASFDGEPMEWRLIVDETWKPLARLRILTFADIGAMLPEEKGIVDFEARVNLDEYAQAVQSVGHSIWKRYGDHGYREAWGGSRGFPMRALKALDSALSTPSA
ncbi:hypothetical protein AEAC466_20205 [Asticcacaulis sp. AC466]|uniref:hypothetical protein n=1 Tax=Asticcacaulis sp. AC466 TaxID=1282362 RepID=UPI0003C3E939|nr:hypothetical protein [Asticcacaulis sp. AC466]ESQ81747.1 hypothetical protein AEAC466_20205 [Asticcacaulis sp. AC466]